MHRLIIGRPESGKTTICQWWCRALKGKVHRVVLNPFGDPGWGDVEFQSPDPMAVMDYCRKPFSKAVFLEEAGTSIARDPKFNWLTSGSRHRGNGTWLIAQRRQMLAPNLRENVGEVYLFACSRQDAVLFADLYDDQRILSAAKFGKGEFLVLPNFGSAKHGQLDWTRKNWELKELS